MRNDNILKIVITGPAGRVGESLLYRLASGEMFGKNVRLDLRLLELESSLPILNGIRMELEDCAFPLIDNVICTSNLKTAMLGANWVFLIGAAARTKGMERADLLKINGSIFSKQGKAINNYAADDVRTLVVGNPCNTNALIAMKNAMDVPNDRFYAMTMLDELRAKALLAKKSGFSVSSITNLAIWGNHSVTQFPDFYNAFVNNKHVLEVIKDEIWLKNDFIAQGQARGAAILKARNLTSAPSAANAIISTVQRLLKDTGENDCFSLGICSRGDYDIEEGLIFSFPMQRNNGNLLVVQGVTHNQFSKNKILFTLDELKRERDMVQALGLIK